LRCLENTQRCTGCRVATRSARCLNANLSRSFSSYSPGWEICAHAWPEAALQSILCSEASRHQCRVGGLAPSLVVELANGSRAVVLDVNEQSVKLDANSMLAGKKLVFEIELMGIEASS
jgi:hypothetical protein